MHTCMAHGIEDGDACAQQWRGILGFKIIGYRSQALRGCDHVLLVSTIVRDTGDTAFSAKNKITAAAGITNSAVSAVPAHTHTLTHSPVRYTGTESIHSSGDLVPRHARKSEAGPMPFFHQKIT